MRDQDITAGQSVVTTSVVKCSDADAGWESLADQAIGRLARAGAPFSADDVRRELGGVEPAQPRRMGLAFLRASKAGIITPVEIVRSGRRVRHGGTLRLWVGAR